MRHGRHLDAHVDAVEQRTGELAAIPRDLVGRTSATAVEMTKIAARTRVHRGDELKARGKVDLTRGARDRHPPRLQRLAQHLQHAAVELGQLVEEKHPAVRERDFPGARLAAAADERGARRRMVRRAERPPPPVVHPEAAARKRSHRGRVQRLGFRHRRQNARQPDREHRLAGARRSDHEHAVSAGCGNFQRALGACLALDVGQIWMLFRAHGPGGRLGRERCRAREVRADGEQAFRRMDHGALDQRRLARAVDGQHECAPVADRAQRHGERAAHGAQLAGERELARKLVAFQALARDLARGGENTERDRKIEASALLRELGWREIDRDAPGGKSEVAVHQGRAHPFPALTNLRVRETHDREARQAVAEMNLDGHVRGVEPGERTAVHDRKGHEETGGCGR
jgi:hypothetical protein